MKVVVVGASSGLGRSIGLALAKNGAQVAFLARRRDRLDEAAAEAGDGAIAVTCDVTDEQSCKDAIAEAASSMGGIDGLVYSTGVGTLARLVDLDAAAWRSAFDTNVIGASLVTAAAIPYLIESQGTAAYLSSVSATHTSPWPGLGSYIVSKAALERLVDAWRAEYPAIGFTRVVVGDCAGGDGPNMTEFPNLWDHELAVEFGTKWVQRNLITGTLMDVSELTAAIEFILRGGASASVPSIIVTPRPPADS
jgi:NAD(P)-dependent dehydrogenase (short-subunit alcohol dehydrogenase family)